MLNWEDIILSYRTIKLLLSLSKDLIKKSSICLVLILPFHIGYLYSMISLNYIPSLQSGSYCFISSLHSLVFRVKSICHFLAFTSCSNTCDTQMTTTNYVDNIVKAIMPISAHDSLLFYMRFLFCSYSYYRKIYVYC